MDGRTVRHAADPMTLAKLIGGLLLPPFAWLCDLQLSYATVKWACAADARSVLILFPLVSIVLVSVATWMSWSVLSQVRLDAVDDGARPQDRNYFLAIGGLVMSTVFLLLIVTTFVPRYVLSPCE